MPKLLQAQAAVILGGLLLVLGTWGLAGWEVAALAAGVEAIAYGLWFVDVDGTLPTSKPNKRGAR